LWLVLDSLLVVVGTGQSIGCGWYWTVYCLWLVLDSLLVVVGTGQSIDCGWYSDSLLIYVRVLDFLLLKIRDIDSLLILVINLTYDKIHTTVFHITV
jgi:hypothetical protein